MQMISPHPLFLKLIVFIEEHMKHANCLCQISYKCHCYSQLNISATSGTAFGLLFGYPEEAVKIDISMTNFPVSYFYVFPMKGCDCFRSYYTRMHSKEEITLTFSDAVAILVPCRFNAIQLKTPS